MKYVGLVSDTDGHKSTVTTEDSLRVWFGWHKLQVIKECGQLKDVGVVVRKK